MTFDALRPLALLALISAGCQGVRNVTPDVLIPEPRTDPASAIRDWPQTQAVYASASTVAGPTGFVWEPKPGRKEWTYVPADLLCFGGNVIALPAALMIEPAWSPKLYRGSTTPTSHTAVQDWPLRTAPRVPAGSVNAAASDEAAEDTGSMVPPDQVQLPDPMEAASETPAIEPQP